MIKMIYIAIKKLKAWNIFKYRNKIPCKVTKTFVTDDTCFRIKFTILLRSTCSKNQDTVLINRCKSIPYPRFPSVIRSKYSYFPSTSFHRSIHASPVDLSCLIFSCFSRSTIAQDYSTYWVEVESPQVNVRKRSIDVLTSSTSITTLRTTTPPYYSPTVDYEVSILSY